MGEYVLISNHLKIFISFKKIKNTCQETKFKKPDEESLPLDGKEGLPLDGSIKTSTNFVEKAHVTFPKTA